MLSNMMNLFHELQMKNEEYVSLSMLIFLLIYHFFSYELTTTDYQAVRATYKELQEHTLGLCKGGNSLPVLAVELQNSCHLLQANMMIHYFDLTVIVFF